jgi:hypothetical protein
MYQTLSPQVAEAPWRAASTPPRPYDDSRFSLYARFRFEAKTIGKEIFTYVVAWSATAVRGQPSAVRCPLPHYPLPTVH